MEKISDIESKNNPLEFDIPSRNAEKIWKNVVERAGGMLDITYLGGKYSEKSENEDTISADVRLYKKRKREGGGGGYQLYINDINKPKAQTILNLLHKLEGEGLLVKSIGTQASHKSYDDMRDELNNYWSEYLQSLNK